MSEAAWTQLSRALDAGPPVRVWLRDDDAVDATPALDRLAGLCADAALPLLLAVIPTGATPTLSAWAAKHPLVAPCQHGVAHRNHAAPGARACELGGERSDAAVLAELAEAAAAMDGLFGAEGWLRVLVPPWNRIRDSLVPRLPTAGYCGLSTFSSSDSSAQPSSHGPPRIDCDLDIIDWRNGRRGRTAEDLGGRFAVLLAAARTQDRAIGLLTHHLVHDAACWAFLDRFVPMLARHPAVSFTTAAVEIARGLGS